jgi:hypothetical protein
MGKENAMNAFELMVLFILIRLVFPFGLVLVLGEWAHKYERTRLSRM